MQRYDSMPRPAKGRWDCHAHIFPAEVDRDATLTQYQSQVLEPLDLDRVVLVQPSTLGSDHTELLSGLSTLRGRGRGVVALHARSDPSTLEHWHHEGVRGTRLSPRLAQGDVAATLALLPALEPLGWHVQLYGDPVDTVPLAQRIVGAGVPVVFDHFGRIDNRSDVPAQQDIISLLRDGLAWIKLSAPYQLSPSRPPYQDLAPLASLLYETNQGAVLWGSDWPHPRAPHSVRDAEALDVLASWGFDEQDLDRILRENPSRLYT